MSRGSNNRQQKSGELLITGALTISSVTELKELLQTAIEQTPLVKVDLGQVEQIDTAGIQLFCAAHRLAESRGKGIEITGAADSVRQLVVQAGFAHEATCGKKPDGNCLWTRVVKT